MNLVVSDTSPISLLGEINHLNILSAIFEQVLIPPEVFQELQHPSAPPPVQALFAQQPAWLVIQQPSMTIVRQGLQAGESAAIALAIELGVRLLIDESRGRHATLVAGVTVAGVVGILEIAANIGLISDLSAVHNQLRATTFRVAEQLLRESLLRRR